MNDQPDPLATPAEPVTELTDRRAQLEAELADLNAAVGDATDGAPEVAGAPASADDVAAARSGISSAAPADPAAGAEVAQPPADSPPPAEASEPPAETPSPDATPTGAAPEPSDVEALRGAAPVVPGAEDLTARVADL
jgi:hypothetical protein